MHIYDALLYTILPTLILLHLTLAPYTKVEESFNLQATHDILTYPLTNLTSYDHTSFPGAVPRTFIGALSLAGVSKPIILLFGSRHAQFIVRAVLGAFNTACLINYKIGLGRAFGEDVGRWWVLLLVSGFHVNYYASRLLPNMFAFGLTTLASSLFLPLPGPRNREADKRRQIKAISLLVFSAVVFRSEIALLLFTQLIVSLISFRISIKSIILTGLISGLLSIATTVAVDSYFWQKPLWPELWGFYFNVFEGKSVEWGTSPYGYYFTSLLPKLLLNPLIQFLLIPSAVAIPSLKLKTLELVIPALVFVAIYSLQPHKEARFIIYIVPQMIGAASLSADWIWKRRGKDFKYMAGAVLLVGSILGCFVASTGMLLISSLNYPGGAAINSFHEILEKDLRIHHLHSDVSEIKIHMDVLSCMTGVTRFQELPGHEMVAGGKSMKVVYDKNEDPDTILTPEFWQQFEYALMEEPERAIGRWQIVDTIFAYSGIEFLKPGDGTSFSEHLEKVYSANNISVVHHGKKEAPDGEEVRDTLDQLEKGEREGAEMKRMRVRAEEMNQFGTFNLLRDGARSVTGGWWVGPRMSPSVRVLRRVRG